MGYRDAYLHANGESGLGAHQEVQLAAILHLTDGLKMDRQADNQLLAFPLPSCQTCTVPQCI